MEEVTGLQNKLTIPYMKKLAADLAKATPLTKESHPFYSICEFLVADIRGQGKKKKEKGFWGGLFG